MATLIGRSAGLAATTFAGAASANAPAIIRPAPRPALIAPAHGAAAAHSLPRLADIERAGPASTAAFLGFMPLLTPHDLIVAKDAPLTVYFSEALLPVAVLATTDARSDSAEMPNVATTSPRPRTGMPGWLVASTQRQAALPRHASRPLDRAAARRPRPGNRPARRAQVPKSTASRKVVWMTCRANA